MLCRLLMFSTSSSRYLHNLREAGRQLILLAAGQAGEMFDDDSGTLSPSGDTLGTQHPPGTDSLVLRTLQPQFSGNPFICALKGLRRHSWDFNLGLKGVWAHQNGFTAQSVMLGNAISLWTCFSFFYLLTPPLWITRHCGVACICPVILI